jgi:hypothetical protein
VIRRYRAVLALAAAGCGSDSSGEITSQAVSIPAVTSPIPTQTSVSTATLATTTTATTTTQSGTTFNPQAPDSATNDVPPKKGSPQAAFEQQCKQQGTCD